MTLPPNPNSIVDLQAHFDEETRRMGLEGVAREVGHNPKTHLEATLSRILTADDRMNMIKDRVRKFAPSQIPVLILGKTGTGKELIAEALHGDRKVGTFVPINCGAIPGDLLESELFGSKKGSFTGASIDRVGLIEKARDGTLFLDEIGDMPPLLQCKLLRVLQSKRYRRVGETAEIEINFRLVSATNHMDLKTREGFRGDLYYRLAGTTLVLPTLKERNPLDISLICSQLSKSPGIAEMAINKANDLALEGNVRELINLIEELNALF